jgi:hypothetical protein
MTHVPIVLTEGMNVSSRCGICVFISNKLMLHKNCQAEGRAEQLLDSC